jgi:hypothetical protein
MRFGFRFEDEDWIAEFNRCICRCGEPRLVAVVLDDMIETRLHPDDSRFGRIQVHLANLQGAERLEFDEAWNEYRKEAA